MSVKITVSFTDDQYEKLIENVGSDDSRAIGKFIRKRTTESDKEIASRFVYHHGFIALDDESKQLRFDYE